MEYPVIGKEIICVKQFDKLIVFTLVDSYAYATIDGIVAFANVNRGKFSKFVGSIKGIGLAVPESASHDPEVSVKLAIKKITSEGISRTKRIISESFIGLSDSNVEFQTEIVQELNKFWIMDILNMGIL